MSRDRKKIVIDTDAGVDDAHAILLALSNPDVDVIAITCVTGNTDAEQVGRNVLRVLQVVNRLDIPVYIGCTEPVMGEKKSTCGYHGSDGFGDVPDVNAPDVGHIQSEHAIQALIRMSKEYDGQLTLVCIGPLTNIAIAIRMDSMFGRRLKNCYIMGGNHQGMGNMTVSAEFNFYYDPEAAYIVLNQLTSPITMVTWETCEKHALSWEFYNKLRSSADPITRFLKSIEKFSTDISKGSNWDFIAADEILLVCLLNHDVIKRSCDVYATVEVKGQYTWGQMVIDWKNIWKRPKNVTVITDINQEMYEAVLSDLQKA